MNKLTLKIDLTKIDKNKIVERKYTNKDGQEVIAKEYSLDLVQLNQPKFIAEKNGWTVTKTHFLAEPQTKEQREKKEKSNIVGDGIRFDKKQDFNDIAEDIGVGADGEVYKHSEVPF